MTERQRRKKCKVCGEPFVTSRALQVACSVPCSLEYVKRQKAKRLERTQKEAREKVKTRREILAECQNAFNAYIRARDHRLPCVSCGRPNDGMHQRHAGHYRPVGSNPALRFHDDNCHAQCATCNNHLSGNLTAYRITLIDRIGLERVEWLEGPHEPAKWEREQLVEMRARFRKMAREANMALGGSQ